MTIIQDLPKEVLVIIFWSLRNEDLERCQYTCRTWYSPAHIVLLRNISLNDVSSVLRFVKSFDHNPKPAYLQAVKRIVIRNLVNKDNALNQEIISKLFCRFSNLEYVSIDRSPALMQTFTEDISKSIVQNCPKLRTFDVKFDKDVKPNQYCRYMHNVRYLATTFDLSLIGDTFQSESLIQYINGFSRLQSILGESVYLFGFEQWVPILEKSTHLKGFRLSVGTSEKDEIFTRRYLASKTIQEQELLVKRLSTINRLVLDCSERSSLNLINFVKTYLTRLTRFVMSTSMYNKEWTDSRHRLFWNIATDIAWSLSKCSIFVSFSRQLLEENLPAIAHKVFYESKSAHKTTSSRILQLKVTYYQPRIASLKICTDKELSNRTIHIAIDDSYGSVQNLFKLTTSLDSVDAFKLILDRKKTYYRGTERFDFYDETIKGMPSLKEITLDIPINFVDIDTRNPVKSYTVHPQVQFLILQATAYTTANMQAMFERCFLAFPNLTRMNLGYFPGVWKEGGGEFQIELPKYSLQTLGIDVSPLKVQMKKRFKNERFTLSDFFVVEVSLLRNSERYLFKVPVQNITAAKSINDKDLRGFTRGKDYLRIYITATTIQCLVLSIYTGSLKIVEESYLDNYTQNRFLKTISLQLEQEY